MVKITLNVELNVKFLTQLATFSWLLQTNVIWEDTTIMVLVLWLIQMYPWHITNKVREIWSLLHSFYYTVYCFFHSFLKGTAEPYITTGKFWWYSDTHDWANWIYKYETRAHTRKCSFECFHDNTCDFFVDVHGYCLYGRWAYTGAKIISWTDDVTIYNKIGMINSENLKSVCFSIHFFIRQQSWFDNHHRQFCWCHWRWVSRHLCFIPGWLVLWDVWSLVRCSNRRALCLEMFVIMDWTLHVLLLGRWILSTRKLHQFWKFQNWKFWQEYQV